MYEIILSEAEKINKITAIYYAEKLEITPQYLSNVFNGKLPVKTPIAKGIISIAYNIPIDDYKMEELLNRHFTKIS